MSVRLELTDVDTTLQSLGAEVDKPTGDPILLLGDDGDA